MTLCDQTFSGSEKPIELEEVEMAAFRIFNFAVRSRNAARSAYDETTPSKARVPLSARWSFSSEGRPACRWQA